MAMGEKGDVAIGQYCAVNDRASSCGHMVDRLPAGKTCDPEIPAGNLLANIGCRAAFVIAIIPLDEVRLNLRHISITGEAARLEGTLEWTGEDQGKTFTGQAPCDGCRLFASGFGQRQIRPPGMRARAAPFGFAVPDQPKLSWHP